MRSKNGLAARAQMLCIFARHLRSSKAWMAVSNRIGDWSAAKRPGAARLVLCSGCAVTLAMAALGPLLNAATSKHCMDRRQSISDVIEIGWHGVANDDSEGDGDDEQPVEKSPIRCSGE